MAQTRKTTENPGTTEPNSSANFGASTTGGGSAGTTAPTSTQRSPFATPGARPPASPPVAPARGGAFASKSIENKPRATEPTHQAIEEAAYFLWLKRGGDEILNWLEAEAAVRGQRQAKR